MKAKIYPSKVSGSVTIPSSKSLTHRYIIAAALANGISKIENISYSDDIITTINILKNLGVEIIEQENSLLIKGCESKFKPISYDFFVNESASSLRFFIPMLSSLNEQITIIGTNKLMSRPMDVYEKIFQEQKNLFIKTNNKIIIKGKLNATKFFIDGNISSQFISGLLFYLVTLDNNSVIKTKTEIESIDYIYMTIDVLKKFGINIDFNGTDCFYIKGNQKYNSCDCLIEGDYSQAAFFATLGAINNSISINNLTLNSVQGDKIFFNFLNKLNIETKWINNTIYIYKCNERVDTFTVDLANYPDLGPILAVFGALCTNKLIINNVERLKIKESNRLEATIELLKNFGIKSQYLDNKLIVYGVTNVCIKNEINSYNDHRIFMAASILATISNKAVVISNPDCINKSYPKFLEDLKQLGVKVEIYE